MSGKYRRMVRKAVNSQYTQVLVNLEKDISKMRLKDRIAVACNIIFKKTFFGRY